MRSSTNRIAKLLAHLSEDSFKPPPVHVGLKTVIRAREAGLVVLEPGPTTYAPRCRLTPEGLRIRSTSGNGNRPKKDKATGLAEAEPSF